MSSRSKSIDALYYKHTIRLMSLFKNRLTFCSRKYLKPARPFCTVLGKFPPGKLPPGKFPPIKLPLGKFPLKGSHLESFILKSFITNFSF